MQFRHIYFEIWTNTFKILTNMLAWVGLSRTTYGRVLQNKVSIDYDYDSGGSLKITKKQTDTMAFGQNIPF